MRKHFIHSLIILFAATTVFTACRKYEEGPNISLRRKEARVTNNWRIQSAQLNGVEVSVDPFWAKQKHYMYRNGDYVVTIIDPVSLEARNLQGKWTLYDNDRKLALTTKNFSGNIDSTNDFHILKLYENDMWIRKIDNSLELHLVPFE